MKILAYSDPHFCEADTLKELELCPDYTNCEKFIEIIESFSPGLVICCGDFSEPFYDKYTDPTMERLRRLTDDFLAGNHDPRGELEYSVNGFMFTHGHKLHFDVSGEDGRSALHRKAQSLPIFVVFGHTHRPMMGDTFMDLGSLTLTGTYGEFMDGIANLRRLAV